jgi:hypothetical protein
MYRAGVPIEIIARKFGHSDTRTTMRYLGLDFEDLSAAEDLYAKYQASLYFPKMEKNSVSQEISGQGGILAHSNDWLTVDLYRKRNTSNLRNVPVRGYER